MTPDPRDRPRALLKAYDMAGVGNRAALLHHDVCIKELLEHAIATQDRLDLLTVAEHRRNPVEHTPHEMPHTLPAISIVGLCGCDICVRSRK